MPGRFHTFLAFAALCLSLMGLLPMGSSTEAAERPNVIVVLIDDLGWTDLSCQGSKFYETPNIDRLAAEGMRFTSGYSACTVCSPTRAALMTGQYPARLHITDWIPGYTPPNRKLSIPDWTMHLAHETTTIAEVFQNAGYKTAHFGKWHLGDEAYWPKEHGFDVNVGGNHRGLPPSYFFPYERDNIRLPGLEKGKENEYLTDRLTDECLDWIAANHDKPFFVYLPHYAVHTRLEAKDALIAKYHAKADPSHPQHHAVYAAMIDSVDLSIGRIMDKLKELKLDERTIVVFTSDNGGLMLNDITSNVPLRAGKGSAYEGGVRVPFIVRYPPLIEKGSECDEPVMTIDLFPTLVELAGVEKSQPQTWRPDGQSIVPLLSQQGSFERDDLYWHFPHYHLGGATPYSAIRAGDWRLVEFFEDKRVELYNLRDDIGETNDLASSKPEKRDELHRKLIAWRKQVDAQYPSPNPNFDPNAPMPIRGKAKARKK